MTRLNLLITGGCGFIGVNLADYLLEKGCFKIRLLDNLSVGDKRNVEVIAKKHGLQVTETVIASDFLHLSYEDQVISPRLLPVPEDAIQLIVGDIRDRETCLKATDCISTVIHLAAHAGVVSSIDDPFSDFETNILGTLNLLSSSVRNNVEKFVFASSNAVLGQEEPPMNESKTVKPLSPYGASKSAGEGYCSAYCSAYGLKTVALRFSNVYGPYSSHKDSVVAKFITDGLVGGTLTIHGDGTQTRDFIHVNDICEAIFLIVSASSGECGPAEGISGSKSSIWGEIFNLGTGQETPIIDLANYVIRLLGNNTEVAFLGARKGDVRRNYSDINKAKTMLGFKPRIDFKNGIKEACEWFLANLEVGQT